MYKKLIRITTVPLSLDKLLGGQLRFMSKHFAVTAVSSDLTYLEKVGKKEGVDIYNVEMTRKITPFKDMLSLWQLYLFFRQHKPFIVHTHTPKAGTVGMIAAKLAGVPNRLHTVAGLPLLEAGGYKRRLLDTVEKLTYACATKVYPNSNGLKEIIEAAKFCGPEKLSVIGRGSSNGIDTQYFNPENITQATRDDLRQTLQIKPSDIVFIFVGRLVSDKGLNELLTAFKRITLQHANVKLLLVGPSEPELDPLHEDSLRMIASEESIITTGMQDDVRPYMAIADMLVFPSYREGFPNVVMQAGAMGLPAIVSDINGCNEIIEEGTNGLIVPVKNSIELFDAMDRLLVDKQLFQELKSNSRQMIVSRFEQQYVWEAILKEYKSL